MEKRKGSIGGRVERVHILINYFTRDCSLYKKLFHNLKYHLIKYSLTFKNFLSLHIYLNLYVMPNRCRTAKGSIGLCYPVNLNQESLEAKLQILSLLVMTSPFLPNKLLLVFQLSNASSFVKLLMTCLKG